MDKKRRQQEASTTVLKEKVEKDDDVVVSMENLDKAAEENEKYWMGMKVIEMKFEKTDIEGVTAGGLKTRQWKHKKIDFSFNQQMNPGNKSWNTGV